MDTANPELQKAIYESLRQPPSPFGASGSGQPDLQHRHATSDGSFGRVDSLRRSGISPAASKCAHTPLTQIRMRRSGSSRSHGSKKSEKSESEEIFPEDNKLKELIEHDIVLPSTSNRLTFDDIAGLDTAKKLLTEAITLPLLMPDFFTGIREPWKGVLLFGPPGTGKTLLAKALAGTDSIHFFNCPSSTLTSKYRGESEKLMRTVFAMARKAAPSIVFFDEADALISKRETADEHEASRRFKSEILQQVALSHMQTSWKCCLQMDGVTSHSAHVMVLATTNCPWDMDEAILRRFEKRIYIPLPDAAARKAALEKHLHGVPCATDVDLGNLAQLLEGYSGADLRLVCKDASMMFMRSWMKDRSPEEILRFKDKCPLNAVVTMNDFQAAINKSNPSVQAVERYESWAAQYGCL